MSLRYNTFNRSSNLPLLKRYQIIQNIVILSCILTLVIAKPNQLILTSTYKQTAVSLFVNFILKYTKYFTD